MKEILKCCQKCLIILSRILKGDEHESKARLVERHFDICLDTIVSDDEKMFDTLVRIKQEMKDTNGNVSNALRKYYEFSNGKRFPTLAEYQK